MSDIQKKETEKFETQLRLMEEFLGINREQLRQVGTIFSNQVQDYIDREQRRQERMAEAEVAGPPVAGIAVTPQMATLSQEYSIDLRPGTLALRSLNHEEEAKILNGSKTDPNVFTPYGATDSIFVVLDHKAVSTFQKGDIVVVDNLTRLDVKVEENYPIFLCKEDAVLARVGSVSQKELHEKMIQNEVRRVRKEGEEDLAS